MFYKKEYEIGLWVIGYVKEILGVFFFEDEVGYIVFYIYMVKMDVESMYLVLKYMIMIKEMIEKIE